MAAITRPEADIAFVTVSGNGGNTVLLDNLRFDAPQTVPELASLAIWSVLGLVGAGVGCSRRNKAPVG